MTERRSRAPRPTAVAVPPTVRYAGFVTAAEGAIGLMAAAVLVVRALDGAKQSIVNGIGTAGWFGIMGSAVLVAGWALVTGRRWGRGIAVFANLLLLPVSWYVIRSEQPVYAIVVGLTALAVLGLLFSSPAIRWMTATSDRK